MQKIKNTSNPNPNNTNSNTLSLYKQKYNTPDLEKFQKVKK